MKKFVIEELWNKINFHTTLQSSRYRGVPRNFSRGVRLLEGGFEFFFLIHFRFLGGVQKIFSYEFQSRGGTPPWLRPCLGRFNILCRIIIVFRNCCLDFDNSKNKDTLRMPFRHFRDQFVIIKITKSWYFNQLIIPV